MIENDTIALIRGAMYSATCAKAIKDTIPLFKDYLNNFLDAKGSGFPDEALSLLLDILSDPPLYTKKGMRPFLYDFTLTSWFIEEFSEDQRNKVIVAIKQNYSQYVESEFCAYVCLLIVELYDGETQQIMPLFDQLYAVSWDVGRAGISIAKDSCSYRLK